MRDCLYLDKFYHLIKATDKEIRNYNINKSQMKSYPVNYLLLELFLASIVMLRKHPLFKGCPKDSMQWRFY